MICIYINRLTGRLMVRKCLLHVRSSSLLIAKHSHISSCHPHPHETLPLRSEFKVKVFIYSPFTPKVKESFRHTYVSRWKRLFFPHTRTHTHATCSSLTPCLSNAYRLMITQHTLHSLMSFP